MNFIATTADPDTDPDFDLVAPNDPRATCFCALGRIAKEAGVIEMDGDRVNPAPFTNTEKFIREALDTRDICAFDVYGINDQLDSVAKPKVIADLRKLLTPTE